MLNFRKVLLAASVASLALVGSASAQVFTGGQIAVANGGAPGYAFIESTAQLVPTFEFPITASGTAPTSGIFIINSNVALTNVLATGSTSNSDVAVFTSPDNTCAVATNAASTVVISGPTQLTATFNTISAANAGFVCFQNLRVNASQVGSTSAITVTEAGVAGGNFVPASSSSANTATVAYAAKSISSIAITPEGAQLVNGAYTDNGNTSTSICNVLPSSTSTAKLSGFQVAQVQINTTPYSMLGATSAQSTPSETGTTVPAAAIPPVAASQGVRIAVTFTNLTAGVNYYVTAPTFANNAASLSLAYYSAASGGSTLTVAGGSTTYPDNIAAAYQLTPSGSSATVYIGVTQNTSTITAYGIQFNLIANIPSNAAVQTFSTSAVAASATLVGATTGYPQYSSTQTATAAAVQGTGGGLLTSCSTTLLFPYVVNNSGFDTAMVITNASTGTGVTAGSGLCTVNFYGTGTSATTLPITYAPTTTLGAVTSTVSNNLSFTASGQAAGISGYAVATCNFVGAHGYAFLFSGAGTPAAYAADYLAVVLQSGATTLVPTF